MNEPDANYVELLDNDGNPLSTAEPGELRSASTRGEDDTPTHPRVYDHLEPLLGRRFRNINSGVVRTLTFVGVAERDRVVARGQHNPFGRDAAGIFRRVNEVRVQLDGRVDIGAEAFVTRWDLLEDDDG